MKIKEISLENRPRERLKNKGVETLSNEELIAILLRCGNKEKSALDIAYELINKAGNLSKLFNMSYQELIKIKGIASSKACILLSAFELSKRALSAQDENKRYDNSKEVYNLISPLIINETEEVLYALYLNDSCHLIEYKKITHGSFGSCSFPIQKILHESVRLSSNILIIVHNHPSGDFNPSEADILSTSELSRAAKILGIYLCDHLIISTKGYYSFSENEII